MAVEQNFLTAAQSNIARLGLGAYINSYSDTSAVVGVKYNVWCNHRDTVPLMH